MKRQGGRDRQRECEWKSEGNIFFGREGGKSRSVVGGIRLYCCCCTTQEYSSTVVESLRSVCCRSISRKVVRDASEKERAFSSSSCLCVVPVPSSGMVHTRTMLYSYTEYSIRAHRTGGIPVYQTPNENTRRPASSTHKKALARILGCGFITHTQSIWTLGYIRVAAGESPLPPGAPVQFLQTNSSAFSASSAVKPAQAV